MKKLLLLFALMLTVCSTAMAQTQTVSYLYPVYNTVGVPTSGIKEWKTAEVNATVVTNSTTTLNAGWYVVTGTNVTTGALVCSGAVHLILSDGAKLTATAGTANAPGIKVSDADNSLAIYGQTAQTGQLIATGGGYYSAGIGGGNQGAGSNITINGGIITATTANSAAGIGGGYQGSGSNITINGGKVTATSSGGGTGIGGGASGSGSNITINGGMVTATGGLMYGLSTMISDGIGSGILPDKTLAVSSNIFVATKCVVKAGDTENPTTEIASDRTATTDIATDLRGKQYATIESLLTANDFAVTNNSFTYDGEAKAATVALKNTIVGAGEMTVTYKQGDEEVTPVNAGEYDIYASVSEGVSYKAFEAAKIGTLTIAKASLTADDFLFAAPSNLVYDSYSKSATITFDDQDGKLTGLGSVTVKYNGSTEAPSLIGEYAVTIDIAEGLNFSAAQGITSDDWNFTIVLPSVQTSYIDADGVSHQIDAYELSGFSSPVVLNAGWYVATNTSTSKHVSTKMLVCSGAVHLILADGFTLTSLSSSNDVPAIQVSGAGNSLTIYGQANQTGQLIAEGGTWAAGIGGGNNEAGSNITINGGIVTATGNEGGAGIGGGPGGSGQNITINGGTVTATGKSGAAGIGGGDGGGNGQNITINGGTVTATGRSGGAGIGGGYDGGSGQNISINGGTVTATGNGGAGIGGGQGGGNGQNITINGGMVTATSSGGGTGIGGGHSGIGRNITINGGTVIATGYNTAGIGSGAGTGDASSDIFVGTKLFVKAGNMKLGIGLTEKAPDRTATTDIADELAGANNALVHILPIAAVPYIDANGVEQTFDKVDIVTSSSEKVVWSSGWYIVKGADVQLAQGAVCKGAVHLILADGAKLTATGADNQAGINVPHPHGSLAVYGQANQTGELIANGGIMAAGIGGGNNEASSNITINGGIVTATSGRGGAAGIGGGLRGAGSYITINGGSVTANGPDDAAGIGGGYLGAGHHITINGGTVEAYGGGSGAGIGGGIDGNGYGIHINGGTVMASSLGAAPCIGGGVNGYGQYIYASSLLVKTGFSEQSSLTEIENTDVDLAGALAGKRYAIITDDVRKIAANQDPADTKHYYSTFYAGKRAYAVPEGVTAYTGTVDGSLLKLTAIAGGIIPAGEPVILRLTTEDNTETLKKFALTATTTTATKSDNNKLIGTDVAIDALGANDYALSLGQNGVGFYLWNGKPIDAHKAYLTLDASEAMAKAFTFDFNDGETTGIKTIDNGQLTIDNSKTYNINGVRVNDNYKGIVIKNGKKYVVK